MVSVLATSEPVMAVEFATINCPPTAFTVSFSNTVVFNVPRILASSTSKLPLFDVDSLTPFSPLTKSFVSMVSLVIKNPPISPPLNNTREPVICPAEVPAPAPLKISSLLELDIAFSVIEKPPISPESAVIFPDKSTFDAVMVPFNK